MTVVSTTPKQLGNHVRKTSVGTPASAYYPQKSIQTNPGMTLSPVVSRPAVVPKTTTTTVSSQPLSSELVIEGRSHPPAPAGTYEPPHARVVPTSAIEDTPGHPRVFLEEKRSVHREYMGMGVHPRYANQSFLEPPRVDVTRLSGSSPSTPSPAGRTHESEPHAPSHHPAIAGYEMVRLQCTFYIMHGILTTRIFFFYNYCCLPNAFYITKGQMQFQNYCSIHVRLLICEVL